MSEYTDASVLAVSFHAGERYAQRVWNVADPSMRLIGVARRKLQDELKRAKRVPNISGVHFGQEALMLKRCVAFAKEGRVTTVLRPEHYMYAAQMKGVRV